MDRIELCYEEFEVNCDLREKKENAFVFCDNTHAFLKFPLTPCEHYDHPIIFQKASGSERLTM